MAALVSTGRAAPIEEGQVLTGQRFEWQRAYSSRVAGSYGQYEIALQAGSTYEIYTSDPQGGNTTDSYLYLLDAGFRVVASDDDSGGNLQARITFTPSAPGTYYIRLRAYKRGRYGFCSLAVTSTQAGTGNPRYPDLITWRNYLLDVDIVNSGGAKLLRFSNAPANIGQDDLTLYGAVQPDGTTLAYQRVWNDNGTYTDHLAGTFSFAGHEDHNHWHFDDFADYNLRAVAPDGSPGAVVAASQKVTFCLMDSRPYNRSLPGAPSSAVYTCESQGISVGWADVYQKTLAGQNIDITTVASGVYWLESIADPGDRLLELDNDNNVARIKIQINKANNSVVILQ